MHDFFVALSYSKLNAVRKEKFLAAKEMGYKLVSFISSRATVLNEGRIGENCFIFENLLACRVSVFKGAKNYP